jgi:hypothetical protein
VSVFCELGLDTTGAGRRGEDMGEEKNIERKNGKLSLFVWEVP